MLGKSVGRRSVGVFALSAVVAMVACARYVQQDSQSGEDAKPKGAKTLNLENGEAKASGIVTYPGGDRVDWKVVELPEKAKGQLDLKLTWTPPRPGLRLAFDVFDEWNQPIVTSKKNKAGGGHGRQRTATINDAKGKYFIRVYAVGRGDAGKYKLTVEFKEAVAGPIFDPLKLDIPEPPKLAAVPEPEIPCDEFQFDPKNPACRTVCPKTGAPPGWPACANVCPTPPDINVPACLATMPCPNPPDRRVKACKPSMWPKCNLAAPDPMNPNCDNAKADPVVTRVLKNEVQGGDTIITIGAGSNSGIQKGWRAQVLRGDSGDTPLPGGDVVIIRIDKGATVGKVRLTTDQIQANNRVKFSPP